MLPFSTLSFFVLFIIILKIILNHFEIKTKREKRVIIEDMAAARHVLTVPLAISSFVGVFYAIAKLMLFLSLPVKIPVHQVWIVNLLDDWSRLETSLLPLTIDAILIVTFILVHSFLRSEIIKALWQKLGLASASRSIYNLVTAATILVRFLIFTSYFHTKKILNCNVWFWNIFSFW